MNIIRRLVGPSSKYDPTLPYTYEARIDPLDGIGNTSDLTYYYSDTLCGLVTYLDEHGITAREVQLFAIFQDEEIHLAADPLVQDEQWLKRPMLCRSLEKHYGATLDKQYAGHERHSACAFTDRDQSVS